MHLCKVKSYIATCLAVSLCSFALIVSDAGAQTQHGLSQFGVTSQNGIESLDLSNLYVKLNIPLLNKPGRGLSFQPFILHDEGSAGSGTAGWQGIAQGMTGFATYQLVGRGCVTYQKWIYADVYNIQHGFPIVIDTCHAASSIHTASAGDGSGLTMTVTQNLTVTVSAPSGAIWTVPISQSGSAPGVRQDNNGNDITVGTSGITDTLGQPYSIVNGDLAKITTVEAAPAQPTTLTYYDSNQSLRTITVNYGAYYEGNQGLDNACGGVFNGVGGPINLTNSIVLANEAAYTFTYEPIPGSPSNYTTGRVSSVTLPTGGTIKYAYSGGNRGYLCEDGRNVSIASLTRTTPDGTWTYTRSISGTYSGAGAASTTQTSTTTVVDPLGNTTVYTFLYYKNPLSPIPQQYIYLHTSTSVYQGGATGTPLLLVETCYNGFARPCANETSATIPNVSSPLTTTDTYTTTGGKTSRSSVTYANSYSFLPSEQDDYDFGATTPTKKTLTQYLTLNSLLTDKVQSVIVEDGNSNIILQTKYGYDESSAASTQGVPQHTAITGQRGNLTSKSVWRNTDGAWLKTTYTNDDTGQRITSTDANGNPPTRYIYTDSWYSGTSACNVTGTNAFLTEKVDPLGHISKSAYDACTGLVRQEQDPNDLVANRSGTITSYDLMGNETSVQNPDGGGTTISYGGYAVPLTVTRSTLATPNPSIVNVSIADTSGRTVREETTSDPSGIVYVDTTYDSLGRTQSTSNPYRSTGDSTYGITSYRYDALGRETITIPPDGTASTNNVTTTYSGNTTTTTDQAGASQQSTRDALGRLAQVTEVNTGWITQYQYDALGNLLCAEQHGGVSGTGCSSSSSNDATSPWRVRRFTYDSLSRLLTSTNPETGVITYSYDANGNLILKTDARGISTNYSPSASPIDGLNRVTQKTYSNGDPTVTYTYDSISSTNGVGRRTGMSAGTASTAWSYDSMGRETSAAITINGIPKTILTSYDLYGSPLQITYPSGSVVKYAEGGAGRVLGVTDTTHSINYASSLLYTPGGSLSSGVYGAVSGGFAGITETNSFNKRLQPTLLSATTPSATIMSLGYNFGLSTNDNGNVYGITNNKANGRSQSFLYDGVNRLTSAKSGTWGATFTIDAWGNYTATNAVTGLATLPGPQTTPTLKNQLTAYAGGYDAAGNLLSDGFNSYTFDAESRTKTGAGVTYTYDGDGRRVSKSSGTLYWGNLAESDLSGNLTSEYVFDGDKRVARRDVATGNVYYYFSDYLGSSNVVTNAAGVIQNESDFYPFGGESQISNLLPNQKFKFTGKERDAESGLDYFGARYMSSNLGRFMSPDYSDGADPVPFGDLENPQSLNLYSYLGNNPANAVDDDGHSKDCDGEPDASLVCIITTGIDKIKDFFSRTSVTTSQTITPPAPPPPPSVPEGALGTVTEPLIRAQNNARANPTFQPGGGATHCNQACRSIADSVGGINMADLGRDCCYDGTANAIADRLPNSANFHQVGRAEAQRLANMGKVVIGVWKDGQHGHVVTVRPNNGPYTGYTPGARGGKIAPATGSDDPVINDIGANVGVYPLSHQASAAFRAGVQFYAAN